MKVDQVDSVFDHLVVRNLTTLTFFTLWSNLFFHFDQAWDDSNNGFSIVELTGLDSLTRSYHLWVSTPSSDSVIRCHVLTMVVTCHVLTLVTAQKIDILSMAVNSGRFRSDRGPDLELHPVSQFSYRPDTDLVVVRRDQLRIGLKNAAGEERQALAAQAAASKAHPPSSRGGEQSSPSTGYQPHHGSSCAAEP